jgi:hypothetical protein
VVLQVQYWDTNLQHLHPQIQPWDAKVEPLNPQIQSENAKTLHFANKLGIFRKKRLV